LKFWSPKKVDKNGRSGSFIENGKERLGRNERVENVHASKNERSIVVPSKVRGKLKDDWIRDKDVYEHLQIHYS
jgi:hypothetical protein